LYPNYDTKQQAQSYDEEATEEPQTQATRRFIFVTKRPRQMVF
jgi:hypothetical protein